MRASLAEKLWNAAWCRRLDDITSYVVMWTTFSLHKKREREEKEREMKIISVVLFLFLLTKSARYIDWALYVGYILSTANRAFLHRCLNYIILSVISDREFAEIKSQTDFNWKFFPVKTLCSWGRKIFLHIRYYNSWKIVSRLFTRRIMCSRVWYRGVWWDLQQLHARLLWRKCYAICNIRKSRADLHNIRYKGRMWNEVAFKY